MELIDLPANPVPPGAELVPVTVDGLRLRVAFWLPPDLGRRPVAGTVVICPGRCEFIEKYFEVTAELLARGFAVVVIDWRGQGGSSRLLANRRKGHVDSFNSYGADLDAVMRQVVRPSCPGPVFGLAHSMGGAIVMSQAAQGATHFERIVLSAPMMAIGGLRFVRSARNLARAVVLSRQGGAYIPGGTGQSWMLQPFAGNLLTADRRRYGIFMALAEAAPQLLIGAPTFGWLDAAFRVMTYLASPGVPGRIATPVLAFACGADRVVESAAVEAVVSRVRTGRTILVPRARHEIMMETDPLRQQFWAGFDAFIPGNPADETGSGMQHRSAARAAPAPTFGKGVGAS